MQYEWRVGIKLCSASTKAYNFLFSPLSVRLDYYQLILHPSILHNILINSKIVM